MLDLILLRHAVTRQNNAGVIQGQQDNPPIDPQFPDPLFEKVMGVGKLTAVYTMDLSRGRLSAEDLRRKAVAALGAGILYVETPLLRERHMGEYEERRYDSFPLGGMSIAEYLYRLDHIPGGESKAQARARGEGVRRKYIDGQQGYILLVSSRVQINHLNDALHARDSGPFTDLKNLQGIHLRLQNGIIVSEQLFGA